MNQLYTVINADSDRMKCLADFMTMILKVKNSEELLKIGDIWIGKLLGEIAIAQVSHSTLPGIIT